MKKTRKIISFTWFPTKTKDNGWTWLSPIIKVQEYRTGMCVMPEGGEFPCYWWKTIEKQKSI